MFILGEGGTEKTENIRKNGQDKSKQICDGPKIYQKISKHVKMEQYE